MSGPPWVPLGDAHDNALCERFFGFIERELIDRTSLRSFTHARRKVFKYVEGWYNPHRRHSDLGYESPISYEQNRQLAA